VLELEPLRLAGQGAEFVKLGLQLRRIHDDTSCGNANLPG
jgi:hypothetical protein